MIKTEQSAKEFEQNKGTGGKHLQPQGEVKYFGGRPLSRQAWLDIPTFLRLGRSRPVS